MLGTDTAGSVRVPAAFCGILGFRPSHGAVPVVGVLPMAQSFDTVGRLTLLSVLLCKINRLYLEIWLHSPGNVYD